MLAPLSPGLMVLQGNHLEDLREVAVQWLAQHPLRPLEDECILVQSNGIAQWLKIALATNAQGKGIAAAVNVQLPGRFIWQAYRSIFTDLPKSSPFDKTPLTWRIYRLLGNWEKLQEQTTALGPLKSFLTADQDPRRRYQLAANLSDLYDQYQLYRADWLEAWEANQDVIIKANGQQEPLPEEQRWQAILWRLLSADIHNEGIASGDASWATASRALVHQQFIKECEDYTPENRPINLPRRVIVFSISSLPRQTLEFLQAIAKFTQVMVFATNPSQHYWGDLIEGKALLKKEYKRIAKRKTPANLNLEDLHAYGHPLLASWGKQGRDFLHLLDEHDQPDSYKQLFHQQKIDLFTDSGQGCLLHQLQSDILHLRPLAERQAQQTQINPKQDQSLQFMVAHSVQREVEILHDQLLDSFETAKREGKTLNPRDILVMVPDINTYAPHIQAVFGRYTTSDDTRDSLRDKRYLPFHIADQSQRRQNTLLIALEQLLHLPQSRFTVSEIADLLDTPALRERFGINEADLPTLRQWIYGANIRWGLNAAQRKQLNLPALEQNTWLFGLQRMLLGFAVGDHFDTSASWQGIEPYTEVAGLEAALVGPLALLLDSLQSAQQQLAKPHTPDTWLNLIETILSDFFVETSKADSWALTQLDLQLEMLQKNWLEGGLSNELLPLEVVREELLAGLDQTNLTQKFLGGSINFATLMPMRAIPFQQLWLLGMNDGDYPRNVRPADFDLMALDYRPGDRSRREDDRYLFLEALLSARQRLVISWLGKDIRDNAERPPSVIVSQLRDHLKAGWQLSKKEADLLAALTTEHPLQPFSQRYFEVDRDPRLFTYAKEWRSLHSTHNQELTNPELTNPELIKKAPSSYSSALDLPAWQAEAPIKLVDLARFLRNPTQYFYKNRLGIQWFDTDQEIEDIEPFHLDGLNRWALKNQLIQRITQQLTQQPNSLIAEALNDGLTHLQRSGSLPLPPFAELVHAALMQELEVPLTKYQQLLAAYPNKQPLITQSLTFKDQLILDDGLADIRSNAKGDCLRVVIQASNLYSGKTLKYYHLVRQWPAHLFAQMRQPLTTHLLGPATHLILPSLSAQTAKDLLLVLLETYFAGMNQLLPLPCKTAFAALENNKPQEAYEGNYNFNGELAENPPLQAFWPDYASLSNDPRFMALAELIYRPVMEATL